MTFVVLDYLGKVKNNGQDRINLIKLRSDK